MARPVRGLGKSGFAARTCGRCSRPNGTLYLITRESLRRTGRMFPERLLGLPTDRIEGLDIDTPEGLGHSRRPWWRPGSSSRETRPGAAVGAGPGGGGAAARGHPRPARDPPLRVDGGGERAALDNPRGGGRGPGALRPSGRLEASRLAGGAGPDAGGRHQSPPASGSRRAGGGAYPRWARASTRPSSPARATAPTFALQDYPGDANAIGSAYAGPLFRAGRAGGAAHPRALRRDGAGRWARSAMPATPPSSGRAPRARRGPPLA
jgi:hypothetical protein